MIAFDSEVATALRSFESDVRRHVAQWLEEERVKAPAQSPSELIAVAVRFACRLPSALSKEHSIQVRMPAWRLHTEHVEVPRPASEEVDIELCVEGDALYWSSRTRRSPATASFSRMCIERPRLQWTPQSVVVRVPSLVMNSALLDLDLPAGDARVAPDTAALERLDATLEAAGRTMQTRIAESVAALFREARRDLEETRDRTLGYLDAVAEPCAPWGEGSVSDATPRSNHHHSHAAAAHAEAASAFKHAAVALEHQAHRFMSEVLEGLALRAVDVIEPAASPHPILRLRKRPFGALRLQPAVAASAAPVAPDAPGGASEALPTLR